MTVDRVLPATAGRLRAVVAAEQVAGRLPSLVAGVVRDGELVWSGSWGRAVNRDGAPDPTPDTQYRIGSITKTLTALLVMQLRDEGALHLGDRLDAHLPGVAFGDRTLLQLLSHSAGISAEPPGSWWERSPGVGFEELGRRLDDEAPVLAAHQQFHYSNVGFALLGEVVARKRETSWAAALQRRLLEPLGMLRTGVQPEPPAATGFSVHPFAGTLTDEPSQDTVSMAPAGQLWSTVADLARYAAFLAHPDPAVIAPETLREMSVVHAGSPDNAIEGAYGLGFRLAVRDDRTYLGHSGSMPGFLAGLFVDRARGTAAVCLANGTSGMRCQGLALDLLTVLDEHEPAVTAPWQPTPDVAPGLLDLLGLWHWGNTAVTMSYDGTQLVSRTLGSAEPWCTYRLDGPDRFVGTSGYHTGETLRVVRRTDRSISHLECTTFVFTRIPYDPQAPIPGR